MYADLKDLAVFPFGVHRLEIHGCYGFSLSDRLNESDLADVWRKLYVVHAKWVDMGLELGLKIHTLEGIRPKCSSDPCQCLREVLKEWLRGVDPLPTWHAIIQALKSPTVGHHQLADCIQTELLSAVSTVPTNSPKTTEYVCMITCLHLVG